MKREDYLDETGLKIYQDDDLYTFTSDSIALSRFARVGKGETVADFCAGVGVVGFNLYALNKSAVKTVTFFEMQKPLFDLCAENIAVNGLSEKFTAYNCRLQDIPAEFNGRFSLILCNPPYMKKNGGEQDKSLHIALCRREIALDLGELIFVAAKCLKFGGKLCLIHRADRLCDVLCAMRERKIEPKRLCFNAASGKTPRTFLVEGVKGGKSGIAVETLLE